MPLITKYRSLGKLEMTSCACTEMTVFYILNFKLTLYNKLMFWIQKVPITTALITISILVALISQLGSQPQQVHFLFFSEHLVTSILNLNIFQNQLEIFQGEIWRVITPIFLHFGLMHLFFNMLWLKDLGSVIELRFSPIYLLAMVLVMGVASNIAQFLWSGPLFGGMSGVLYGLFGFMWIRPKFDPDFDLELNKQVVVMMLVWFLLCLTGLMGNVANMAHASGLITGIIWGYVSAQWRPKARTIEPWIQG